MKTNPEFAVLAEFAEKIAAISEQIQQVRDFFFFFFLIFSFFFQISSQLSNDVVSQLLIPLNGVLEGDLAEAEFSKKRFNKVLFFFCFGNIADFF
jgi:hypothetical protein